MKLPIDVHNDEVLSTLLFFIESYFVQKVGEVPRPHLGEVNLSNLETYYQEVNLYYSFCKSFNIEFDVEWVYDERLRISELINDLLIKGRY
ncbi:MAG: SUV3 C-terminal domain-containing protein [Turicibacter sanguinis]